MNITGTIPERIGGPPLVHIGKLNRDGAEVVAEVESFIPGVSVKERIAFAKMEAEDRGGNRNVVLRTDMIKRYLSTRLFNE